MDAHTDCLASTVLQLSLVAGLSSTELEHRIALAARCGEICNRALAFYLCDMERRRVHHELGFASAVHFAMNRLGMSKSRARDLLMTGRKLEELPRLDRAFAEGTLSWSKVRRLARVATAATEARWIERARTATHEQVDALVSVADEGDLPPDPDRGLPQTRLVKRFALDPLQWEMFEQAREKLAAELGQAVRDDQVFLEGLRLFLGSEPDGSVAGRKRVDASLFRVAVRAEAKATMRHEREPLETDAQATMRTEAQTAMPHEHELVRHEHEPVEVDDVTMEAVASDAEVSGALRRRVLARDDHRCQACGAQRSLMVHHVVWRSHGGGTYPGNLVTLCARCHALVHDELLFVTGTPKTRWVFRDRRGRELSGRLPEVGAQLRMSIPSEQMRATRRTSMCAGAHAVAHATAHADAGGARDAGPCATAHAHPHSDAGVRERRETPEGRPAPAASAASTPPAGLEPLEIPDEVDAKWWLAHEHRFEWTKSGKLRVKGGYCAPAARAVRVG